MFSWMAANSLKLFYEFECYNSEASAQQNNNYNCGKQTGFKLQ